MLQSNTWQGWGLQGFGWLFLLGIIIILIWLLIGYRNRRASGSEPHESPIESLDKRFAKGEMTREEYEEAKEALENN